MINDEEALKVTSVLDEWSAFIADQEVDHFYLIDVDYPESTALPAGTMCVPYSVHYAVEWYVVNYEEYL